MKHRLDAALVELRRQVDPGPVLDALEAQATRDGRRAALGAWFASDGLAGVPERARLAIWLRAARLAELDGAAQRTLAERYASAARSGSPERERRLLEEAKLTFEQVASGANAVALLSDRLARLPAPQQTEEALLLAVRVGGKDAEAALTAVCERWLTSDRAAEGVSKLPPNVATFRGEAALDALERLFTEARAAEAIAELLERRAALETTALGRGRALEKLASCRLDAGSREAAADAYGRAGLAYEAASELDDAERAFEQVLQIAPDELSATKKLVVLRARAGNFAGAAAAFGAVLRLESDNRKAGELLLAIADDAERLGVAAEYAELADDMSWRLGSDERTLQQRLLRESARLYAAQTLYDEAAELYRRTIADQATSEDLDAYQALIDAHPVSNWRSAQQRWLFEWQEHHSADRPTVLLSWARFEEQELGDPALAQGVLERAAQIAPDRAEIWENLTRLRLAAGDASGGVAASHQLRRLGREPDASLLELLLEHEPGARWAIDRVKLTLSAEARWHELFELYDRAIDATADVGERAAWFEEAAVAARDVAQDPERATQYWEKYLELVPSDPRADKALERLYEQAGDETALLRHLQRRSARSSESDRAALAPRIVGLALAAGALEEALGAIDRLPSDAADTGARLLEQLFARSQELGGNGEAHSAGRRAARRLRQGYAERGDATSAARLLRAELELELETDERRTLLAELSRLSETALGDLAGAREAQRELFLSTLADAERERLESLTRAHGCWSELCETLAVAAEAEPELDGKRRLLQRAAELASTEARDSALAARLYGQMLQLDPERALAAFESLEAERGSQPEAFDALCRLLEASGQFDQLSSALERAAERTRDPALFSKLGRLQAEQLGDVAAAIDSHLLASDARTAGQVFLRQPSVFGEHGKKALDLAARLHAAGLTEGSLLVLRHQLAFYEERTPQDRKAVVLQLVRLLEESGATDAARDELSEAAKHFPTDAEVQLACAKSAIASRDWDAAEQYYRTLLLLLHGSRAGSTSLKRATVYVELAAIKLERGDAPAAQELIDSGFEAALGSAPDLVALAEGLLRRELHAPAERAVRELLKLAEDLPTAARALACLAKLARDQKPQAVLVDQAAALAESVASRYAELDDADERASLVVACIGLLSLEKAENLLSEARRELTPEQAVGVRLELSRRLLDSNDTAARARAIAELQLLLALPTAETQAWPLLVRALQAGEHHAELKLALAARLEREPTDGHALRAALGLALGGSDLQAALACHERLAGSGQPRDAELSARLIRLCLDAGETEAALGLLEREAVREPEPEARGKLLLELAELSFAQGKVAQARAAALEANRVDAGSAEAVLLSAKLALADGRRSEALGRLSDYAESKQRRRGTGLSAVLRLAAELHLQQDELSEALPLLLEAHQLDKSDIETALLLGLLAIDLDRLDTAGAALRAVVAEREAGNRDSARSPSIAQGYFQLARIEQHHGKKINAKRMALRALEENPNLAPAQRLLSELGPH